MRRKTEAAASAVLSFVKQGLPVLRKKGCCRRGSFLWFFAGGVRLAISCGGWYNEAYEQKQVPGYR